MLGLEEMKSVGPDNLTRHETFEPAMLPTEQAPHVLGRPSLSESTGAASKNFSPAFDKRSSNTRDNQPHRSSNENLLDDEDEEPSCRGFI